MCENIALLYSMSNAEKMIIDNEIEILLKKGVIVPSDFVSGDFVSAIFTRPKADGSYRVTLNLKKLNESGRYKHCKLESLYDVLNMILPGAYMASVDNKDAYYSIPINEEYIKFLKRFWDGKYYAFQCIPNLYGPALRAFAKIIKQPFRYLRCFGHLSVIYIDYPFLLGETFQSVTSMFM